MQISQLMTSLTLKILIKYDEERYLSQFVSEMFDSLPGFSVEAGNRGKSAGCEHEGSRLFRLQNFRYSFKL